MLTRPNVRDPFQIAAIRVSPGWSELSTCAGKQIKCRPRESIFVRPGMQKSPAGAGLFLSRALNHSGDFRHVGSLWSFLALNNFELDLTPLGERLEAGSAYRAEMHEDIGPSLARNESESLGVVEPFDRTGDACHLAIPLSAGQSVKPLPSEQR